MVIWLPLYYLHTKYTTNSSSIYHAAICLSLSISISRRVCVCRAARVRHHTLDIRYFIFFYFPAAALQYYDTSCTTMSSPVLLRVTSIIILVYDIYHTKTKGMSSAANICTAVPAAPLFLCCYTYYMYIIIPK